MKVWIVQANDRCYDSGSEWLVGVFSTEESAKIAGEKDRLKYIAATHPGAGKYYDSDIYEWEVDE